MVAIVLAAFLQAFSWAKEKVGLGQVTREDWWLGRVDAVAHMLYHRR